MKFKIGDRVRIIANKEQLSIMGIYKQNLTGVEGKISAKNPGVWRVDCGKKHGGKWWIKTEYLELVNAAPQTKPTNPKDSLGIKKAPLSTMPTGPMYEVALAMLEGARKYGRHNYRVMGVKASVYYDAAMGHLTAWWEGEDIDPASGLHHLAKAMACIAVVRDSMMMENWVDDRPPKYPDASKLMRNHPAVETILEKYPDRVEPYTELNKSDDRNK